MPGYYSTRSIDTCLARMALHCWFRFPRPDTAPPSLPNCLPSPDRALAGGAAGAGGSFTGTGGAVAARFASLGSFSSSPSLRRKSPTPKVDPWSRSPPGRRARLARSCTLRNFSKSSFQRIMPSSRPFSLLGRSKLEPLGVVALLCVKRVSEWCLGYIS